MMKLKSLQVFCRNASSILAGSLTLAVAANAIHPEQAAAIDLSFANPVETTVNNNPFGFGFGPGVQSNVIHYTNVATGVDARITASISGANYSFVEHIPNYSTQIAGEPAGDSAFLYQSNGTGLGGMTYKIDLFQTGSNFTTAYTAPDLRFLVYDVDGETPQGEAVRIAKNSGLTGYQVGNTAQALIPTEDATSYLFSGRNVNIAETNAAGAAIFYFENVNSVSFQFEANTRTGTSANPVFSAIDGDLSLIGQDTLTNFGALVSTRGPVTAVPEPFTIIGTLVGGTAALRMRKKLKSSSAA